MRSPCRPFYVHLVKHEEPDLALNHFFFKLMSHLTFFRKRTTLDFEGVLGSKHGQIVTIQGYHYNLRRQLVPAEPAHPAGTFRNPKIRFNLYARSDRLLFGQVCYLPWQDGAVITCSVRFNPKIIFEHYFRNLQFSPAGSEHNLWFSSVLPITEASFVAASAEIHRDPDYDDPPSFRLP